MADNKNKNRITKIKTDPNVQAFFDGLKNGMSDEDLAKIIKDHPEICGSEEFMKKTFPRAVNNNDKLGIANLDKMMDTVKKMKHLEACGLISAEQLNNFLNGKHPATGDTMANYVAKNATAAFNKAYTDRSPNPNMPEEDKEKLAQNHEKYSAMLEELKGMGADMTIKNNKGHNVADIQATKTEKSNVLSRVSEPNTNEAENSTEALEVGGNAGALRVAPSDNNALKVGVGDQQPPTDEENEATVEDAPKEDKKKGGNFKGEPIRERDIIDYMYNEWFLAGLSWCLNKAVGACSDGVDNVCDKFDKKWQKRAQDKALAKDLNTRHFNDKAMEVLKKYPQEMNAQFATALAGKDAYSAQLYADIRANAGKPMAQQNWTALDVNTPNGRALANSINAKFAENPNEFMSKLQDMEKNAPQLNGFMAKAYDLSVQMATVQYMKEQMGDKKSKLADMNDEQIKNKIAERAQKNMEAFMTQANLISDHVKLDALLNGGVTDPAKQEQYSAEAIANYMMLCQRQTANAKLAILDDVAKSNHKLNGQKLSDNTNKQISTMDKLVTVNAKDYDALLPNKRKEYEQKDLQTTAKDFNLQDILNNQGKEMVGAKVSNLEFNQNNQSKRKAYFKELVASKFSKYHDGSKKEKNQTVVQKIVQSSRANRGA